MKLHPALESAGRRPWAALGVLLLMSSLAMAPAQAQPLPPAGPYYGVGIDGFGSKEATSFGPLDMSNEFGSASAIVGTNPQPFVSLNVTSSDPTYGAHDTSAFGTLGYYVRVAGPVGGQVPVWITASGFLTYSSSNANLNGSLKIVRQNFNTPLVEENICHHSLFCGTTDNDSFALKQKPFTFVAGALYYVSMVAQATAMTNGGGNGYATVFLDPYFEIDPNFAKASDYTLQFSPGIVQQPVPEPGTVALWLAGLGLLAGARRPHRKRAS